MILALLWTLTAIYTAGVASDTSINGYWRFAGIAPAVLIAIFLSAFVYDWIVHYFSPRGAQRTGEIWAWALARKRAVSEE